MSGNTYSELNLHIVWHTKNSMPLLTPEIETTAHAAIRSRILETPGVFFHEIGGTENHVHVAVSIPPTLTISTFIGELKGGSSHTINQTFANREGRFAWQVGYGVVSFGTADLKWVKGYIQRQKEHHANNKTHDRLERITDLEGPAEGAEQSDQPAVNKVSEKTR
jgi:putative transposase